MRLSLLSILILFTLTACQEVIPVPVHNPSPVPIPDPDPGPVPIPDPDTVVTVVELPLYTYDHWEVPLTKANVGNTVAVDASSYSYDSSIEYTWVTWTGVDRHSGAWNSYAFGDIDLIQQKIEFPAQFPGYYKISWCPANSALECVLFGELIVEGEAPVNKVPEVELYYSDDTNVKTICSYACRALFDVDEAIKLYAEIDDDDSEHSFSWKGRLNGQADLILNQHNLSQDDLSYAPTDEGEYRMQIYTYDGHVTVNGRQKTQSSFKFVVRDADNAMPQASFAMVGHPNVNASMVFQFDEVNSRYFPVINYYYEETFSIVDCAAIPDCDNDRLRFDLYQNNRGTEAIPTFEVGDSVSFNASNSSDPEGEELSYLWSGYIDAADTETALFLTAGADDANYTVQLDETGDYYVSLCVQEKGRVTLYPYNDRSVFPLYWLPNQLCSQIQFRVTE